jgi:L-iditol 2-dehydrogenase
VVVAGVGAIGLLCAQVARAAGARVIVCGTGVDGARFAVARQLGIERIVNVEQEDAPAAVRALTAGEGADVFLECSGAPAAAGTGVAVLRRGGRYCQVGLFGRPFEFDLEQVAYKELHVAGSIGSKWTSWRTALALLAAGQVLVGPLADEPLPLSEWRTGFARFQAKRGIKVLLRPEQ